MNWAYSIRITLMTIRPKKCAAWIPSNLFDPNISIGLTKKKALENIGIRVFLEFLFSPPHFYSQIYTIPKIPPPYLPFLTPILSFAISLTLSLCSPLLGHSLTPSLSTKVVKTGPIIKPVKALVQNSEVGLGFN